MTKIIISMLFLFSINISANLVDDGVKEYKKGNTEQAIKLYDEACKSGQVLGCTKLAVLYFTGNSIKQNQKKAKKLFEKSCKKRHSEACYYLGTIYKRGAKGIKINTKRSRNFYAYSCSLGYMLACKQYKLIREKPEVIGSGKNVINSGYTYSSPEIYGG